MIRECGQCKKKVKKGYSKDPHTGKESKKIFLCDPCFEYLTNIDSQLNAIKAGLLQGRTRKYHQID